MIIKPNKMKIYETRGKESADKLQQRIVKYVLREDPLGKTSKYVLEKSPEDIIPVSENYVELISISEKHIESTEDKFLERIFPGLELIYHADIEENITTISIDNNDPDKAFVKIFGRKDATKRTRSRLEEISLIKLHEKTN